MYKLEELKSEALSIVESNALPAISSMDDYAKAGDILKVLKNKVASIEEKRKSFTDPINKQVKAIKADFDKSAEPILAAIDRISAMMMVFWKAEKARADAEQAKLDAEAAATAGPDGLLVPIVNDLKTTCGDFASTSVRAKMKARVIDENLVPRELCSPDKKKVDAWLALGKPAPAGVEYYEDLSLTSR